MNQSHSRRNLMQHLRGRFIVLACLLAIVAVAGIFAACGDDDNASTTPTKSATGAATTATAATPDLDSLDCATVAQLAQLFKTDGAKKWSDVDPSWPANDIHFYYPGTASGTFDYFLKEVVQKPDAKNTHRGDGTSSEDDNVIA